MTLCLPERKRKGDRRNRFPGAWPSSFLTGSRVKEWNPSRLSLQFKKVNEFVYSDERINRWNPGQVIEFRLVSSWLLLSDRVPSGKGWRFSLLWQEIVSFTQWKKEKVHSWGYRVYSSRKKGEDQSGKKTKKAKRQRLRQSEAVRWDLVYRIGEGEGIRSQYCSFSFTDSKGEGEKTKQLSSVWRETDERSRGSVLRSLSFYFLITSAHLTSLLSRKIRER